MELKKLNRKLNEKDDEKLDKTFSEMKFFVNFQFNINLK